jgi:hypothetical protein
MPRACRPILVAKSRHLPRRAPAAVPPPSTITPGVRAAYCALTAVAATVERCVFSRAWGESASLTSAFYYGDAPRFVEYAKAILERRVFDNGIPFHPPGWPLLLAGFLQLTDAGRAGGVVVPVAAVKLLIACLSGLTVGLSTLLAYEIAGVGAMLAVSFLGVFHFGHIVEGAVANSESLYGLCLIATLWAAWRWLQTTSEWKPATLAGIAAGCATLVRAEFLSCVVVVGLVAWRSKKASEGVLAFALAICVVLAPSTIWHWRTLTAFNASHAVRVAGPLPRFAPVTSYGPFNFAMANHPDADGGPNRDHPMLDQCNHETDIRLSAGQLDLECPAVYDLYVHGYTIGARWALENPGDALALAGRKLGDTIGFLADGYFFDNLGAGIDGTRRRVDMVDPSSDWLVPLHLGLLLWGAIVLWPRPLSRRLLAAPTVALVASTLMFYGYVRLGVAYLPALWIVEGAAVAAITGKLASRRGVSAKQLAVAAAALALLVAAEAVRSRDTRSVVLVGVTMPNGAVVQDETLDIRRER